MKILIINGKGFSGKDTFVDYLEKYAKVNRYSTIDNIKDIAKKYFDWNGEKDLKGRKLLSDLKIASIEYNNKPHEDMIKAIEDARNKKYDLFTCMIRDIPEIEKACNDDRIKKDIITIMITSDRTKNNTYGNVGDDNVYNYHYNYYIDNSGTLDDLRDAVDLFVADIGLKNNTTKQLCSQLKKEIDEFMNIKHIKERGLRIKALNRKNNR